MSARRRTLVAIIEWHDADYVSEAEGRIAFELASAANENVGSLRALVWVDDEVDR